ncbi:MAG: hypothetical protein HKN00_04705 [Flavobacteriaceae bacterium]|nr:hypothetical protein [Bacteroidia bacterium]MBT8288616.1 hypothetical protein [Bacteroidia bacterium]NNF74462.1 hypothetical protein [Flavobacteriaceae bacterium]NNK74353.1 hypothetical protein [Flavobacteriaceae bacterium]NNL80228.1 hypothetical protein [Flavobacteriaceae bacterium]
MVVLTIILLLIIFYVSMALGSWLGTKNTVLYKLGERTYDSKLKQLETSAFFNPIRKYRERGAIYQMTLFLFPLILIKSIAFMAVSCFLIAPILLLFQGMTMGSLIRVMKDKQLYSKMLYRVIFWQLLGHVVAAAMGTYLGYKWLIGEQDFQWDWFGSTQALLLFFVVVITAWMAAYFESQMILYEHQSKKSM